jgi:hypothetical protein
MEYVRRLWMEYLYLRRKSATDITQTMSQRFYGTCLCGHRASGATNNTLEMICEDPDCPYSLETNEKVSGKDKASHQPNPQGSRFPVSKP